MKTIAISSFFVLFAIASGMVASPAFADHATASVSTPQGTSVPGCEATNECYIPYEVTIDVGGVVTWTNDDSAAHTVTGGSAADGPSGVFDSSLFMAGTTFEHKFETAGTFPYFCMVHPWMEGIVVVQEAGAE
ncbi:MAG: cupredoxin domain-containing protein, partial [Nitrosopumilaceae archaeon]